MVEENRVGGVCLNAGCIPTKAMLYCSSLFVSSFNGKRYGLNAQELTFDETSVDRHRNLTVTKLVKGVENLLASRGVEIVSDRAESVLMRKVKCRNCEIEGDKIIIATGSCPADIPSARFDGEHIIGSNEAVKLKNAPSSVLIVGGGVIGIEMATYWASIGKSVFVVEMLDRILPLLNDPRASAIVTESLKKKKARIITGERLEKCEVFGDAVKCHLSGGESLEVERVLISTGRKPNSCVASSDLFQKDNRGHIVTDEACRTSVENVFAIGDVAGEPYLAHKASHEAEVAVSVISGKSYRKEIEKIPSCVFSDPEVATVGITPYEAEEKGLKVVWGEFPFSANGKAVSSGMIDGYARIVARKPDHVIVGGQITGACADILIAEISLALRAELSLEDLAETVHVHPSLGEILPEAARDAIGKALHK